MKLWIMGGLLVTAAFACACRGANTPSTPTPSSSANSPLPVVSQSPVATLAPGVVHFLGEILETDDGCAADATCSITVRVTAVLEGDAVRAGEVVTVIESHGFSKYMCYGQWPDLRRAGWTVEVLAGPDEISPLTICDEDHYERIVSTPSP